MMLATGADIAQQIEIKLVVKRRVNRNGRSGHEERIAVWSRPYDGLRGNIAGSARSVLDDEWLAEPLLQPLSYKARNHVGLAASRKADDHAHRPVRIRLRPTRSATWPAARQRPRPDAEIVGGEVSSWSLPLASASIRSPRRRS